MKCIYSCLTAVAITAACCAASAQDLDPTVIVNRAYEGKLMEVHKPSLEMSVPDTVMRFDLDFDYSVFESPYKGSYEFQPYLLSMKPSAAADEQGRFFLRAGAGYQAHPELDAVWSPDFWNCKGLGLDVYAGHRSFIGNYWEIAADGNNVLDRTGSSWKGYDLDSRAGVNLKYDWKKGRADLDVAYYGVHQKEDAMRMLTRGYNALDVSFLVGSNNRDRRGFVYGLSGRYRYSGDSVSSSDTRSMLRGNDLEFEAVFGGSIREHSRVLVDLDVDFAGYKGRFDDAAAVFSVTPHYVYEKGRFEADLGVSFMKSAGDAPHSAFVSNAKEQIVYPDASLRLIVHPKALTMFLKAGGGTRLYSYSSLLERNRHAIAGLGGLHAGYDMGVAVERLSLSFGFEGRFGSRFGWNLNARYANHASGILDVAAVSADGAVVEAGVAYRDYRVGEASFSWIWNGERFKADGEVVYSDAWGKAFEESSLCLKPAGVTGDVSFEYNYNRRIYAGVDCAFSTGRTGGDASVTIPGYADLGVSAEYVTSRGLSFWLRGGNLLGMTIQRDLLYAEKGVYFTLGICLKL